MEPFQNASRRQGVGLQDLMPEGGAVVGVAVTTYEQSEAGPRPVLSHVFWGRDLQEAMSYAQAHLLTDYFFSSSFSGEMEWQGSTLVLSNEGRVVGRAMVSRAGLKQAWAELEREAERVHAKQRRIDLISVLERASV